MLLPAPVGMEVASAVASAAVVVGEVSVVVAAASAAAEIVLAVLAVELVIRATGTASVDRPLLMPLQAQVVDAEASEVVTAAVVAGLIVE